MMDAIRGTCHIFPLSVPVMLAVGRRPLSRAEVLVISSSGRTCPFRAVLRGARHAFRLVPLGAVWSLAMTGEEMTSTDPPSFPLPAPSTASGSSSISEEGARRRRRSVLAPSLRRPRGRYWAVAVRCRVSALPMASPLAGRLVRLPAAVRSAQFLRAVAGVPPCAERWRERVRRAGRVDMASVG